MSAPYPALGGAEELQASIEEAFARGALELREGRDPEPARPGFESDGAMWMFRGSGHLMGVAVICQIGVAAQKPADGAPVSAVAQAWLALAQDGEGGARGWGRGQADPPGGGLAEGSLGWDAAARALSGAASEIMARPDFARIACQVEGAQLDQEARAAGPGAGPPRV